MFWSRQLVSDDLRDWIETCFDWFDSQFPPADGPILPTKQFFRAGKGQDLATAQKVLDDVKRLMGFDLPIALEPIAKLSSEYTHTYQALSDVGGTFAETQDGRLIRYNPEQMQRPLLFISTMAHEVMHARLAGMVDMVPGGEGAHELATDLGCIIAGFGVFQMQAANDAGWSGYMTQESRAHALALFLERRGLGQDAVSAHLSGRCQKLLKKAVAHL